MVLYGTRLFIGLIMMIIIMVNDIMMKIMIMIIVIHSENKDNVY